MLSTSDLNQIRSIVSDEIKKETLPIKKDIGTLKSDVGTLKSDVGTLKSDVGTLKSDMVTVKKEVKLHTKQIKKLQSTLDTTISFFDRENINLKRRVSKIENNLNISPLS